jgi:hypothetical protein
MRRARTLVLVLVLAPEAACCQRYFRQKHCPQMRKMILFPERSQQLVAVAEELLKLLHRKCLSHQKGTALQGLL